MGSKNLESLFSKGRLVRVLHFLTAQGLTVVGNLLYGLLCVRLLPVADYAKFVVLFGVQGSLITLMDANLTATVLPLVGDRVDDLQLIADYVASLQQLSQWVYGVVGLCLVFVFPFLVSHRGWSHMTVLTMIVTLLVSTWFIRLGSAYGSVLIIRRDRDMWYRGQLIASLGTLLLLVGCWAAHLLSAFAAILINVSGIVFIGVFYFLRSRKLLLVRGQASREKQRAIYKLALPNIPQAVFFAVQGQVSLFLMTIFGRTGAVAGIGALGRLGQIFALFGYFNPLFIEPYFAKLPKSRLKRNYAVALLLAATVCTSAWLTAVAFPGMFLWVLGKQYRGLHHEMMIAMLASAISAFSSVLWGIHSARKFVYWWTNICSVVLILLVQVLFIVKGDLGSMQTVLRLNLCTNAASLLINAVTGVYGLLRGARNVGHIQPVLPESPVEGSGYTELRTEP